MERSEVVEKIKDLVVELASIDRDTIKEDSNFIDDLGFDSLDNIELVQAIEEEFGIEIDDAETEKVGTVGNAADLTLEKIP